MTDRKEIRISPQLGKPKHFFFFDQFAVTRNGEFTDLDFKDQRSSTVLVVRVANDFLQTQRKSFLKNTGEIGKAKGIAPAKAQLAATEPVLFADLIEMARHGSSAEIVFYAISWKLAIDQARASETTHTESSSFCVALLRCDVNVQVHWIGTLYANS